MSSPPPADAPSPNPVQPDRAEQQARRMVRGYGERGPYRLHPSPQRVEALIKGLARNKREHGLMYCPCVAVEKSIGAGRTYICPCTPHHEDIARTGACDCALFVSKDFAREHS